MDSLQTIRVLLLGDSGVGKTSIVNYLCKKNELTASSGWTVSCHLDAVIIEFGESNNRNNKYLVEFIDVGGGSHGYAASRSVFYTFDISAILLVHDLSNIRSFSNLFKWIDEFSTVNGFDSSTTNNRMELQAAISALEYLSSESTFAITTDSQYVRLGITQWIKNWEKNQWRTANRQPVKNVDLWQKLQLLTKDKHIEWHWVKGHSGHPQNEMADQLANIAIDEGII